MALLPQVFAVDELASGWLVRPYELLLRNERAGSTRKVRLVKNGCSKKRVT